MSAPEKSGSSADKPANVYEKYYPKERIAELGDVILKSLTPLNSDNVNEVTVTWTDAKNDRFYILRTSRKDHMMGFVAHLNRWLITHIAHDSPAGRTTNQYLLESNSEHPREYSIKPVKQTVKDGQILEGGITDEFVAVDALRILYDKAPNDAENLLQKRFDSAFNEELVGEYLLSDLAVVTEHGQQPPEVKRETIVQTVFEFETFIKGIENEELQKSLSELNPDNPIKHAAVADAIESSPVDGRHWSKYVHPNLAKAAVRVSARFPHGQWNNVIDMRPPIERTPDLSDFITSPKPEPEIEPEPEQTEPGSEGTGEQQALFEADATQPIDTTQIIFDQASEDPDPEEE